MMRAAPFMLLLAACATPAPAGSLPTREDMAVALRAWMTCDDAVATNCAAPPERILVRSLRCRPAGEAGREAQMLCNFSYTASYPWHAPLGRECAWLSRDAQGAWRIDSYPDADRCES
jgi:hypothetical protein